MLETLNQIAEALENLGYEVQETKDGVACKVAKLVSVLTIDSRKQLNITCQIAKASDIEDAEKFALVALDANTRVLPYAIAMITANDNPEEYSEEDADCPVVLIDSIPLGNLNESELASAMDSLLEALMACKDELSTVLS